MGKTKEAPVVQLQQTVSVPANRLVTVTLDKIDNKHFRNTRRGIGTKAGMLELRKSLARTQLQTVVAGDKADGSGMLDLVVGFRRYEAFTQNAIDPLADKYNKEHGYKTTDVGKYIDVTVEADRERLKSEWPEAYQEALTKVEIKVNVLPIEDAIEATLHNLDENYNREDISTADLCAEMLNLVNQGIQQQRIADGMGCTKGKVSQYVSIGRMRSDLEAYVLRDEVLEAMPEDRRPKHKALVQTIFNEYDRRVGLNPKSDHAAINFVILRKLDEQWKKQEAKTEGKWTALELTELLRKITCVDAGGNIDGKKSPPDFDVFVEYLKQCTEASMPKVVKPAVDADEVDVSAKTTEAPADTLAKAQQDIKDAKVDKNAIDAPAAADALAKGAKGMAGTVADGVAEASTANAIEGELSEEDILGEGDDEPSAEDLLEVEGGGEATVPTGEKATTRQDAPVEKYKPKMPVKIESHAMKLLESAVSTDEQYSGLSFLDRAANLRAASFLYMAIGMDTEDNTVNAIYEKVYSESLDYIEKLEAIAKEAGKTIVRPGIPTIG